MIYIYIYTFEKVDREPVFNKMECFSKTNIPTFYSFVW